MKGKLAILSIIFLGISYYLYNHTGPNNRKPKQTTTEAVVITGQVTDRNSGEAVVNATIQVSGTPTKAATNASGEYEIPAEKGDMLIISHPRYRRTSVEITEDVQDIELTAKDRPLNNDQNEEVPLKEIVQ